MTITRYQQDAHDSLVAVMLDRQQMREALIDLRELVEDQVDIDRNGNANLAMQVFTIVTNALLEKR